MRILPFSKGNIRFLCSASSKRKTNWDPTISLVLNHQTLILLEKCSTRDHFKQILAHMMRSSLIGQTFPMSRLLLFSAISFPDNLDMAILLFNHFTPQPNTYIYNTLISALSFSTIRSFCLYGSMLRSCICPNKQTLLYVLQASKCLSEAKQIQCHAIITGLLSHGYLQNSFIKMYLDKGEMGFARQVFRHMLDPDAVSFNIMILGYAKKGYSFEALNLFSEMVGLGLEPDEYTMVGGLMCCGHLGDARLGKSVHAWIERRKLMNSTNLSLQNALLDMYVKCKELKTAQKVFDSMVEKDVISWNTMISGHFKSGNLDIACSYFEEMPCRDIVSWNSVISGYAQTGDYTKVRNLFIAMVAENITPDKVTLLNLLSAATEIGALDQGRCIHGWVIRTQMRIDVFMASAFIDMYCKCGNIGGAFTIFEGTSKKDVTLWTTMIAGFAFHGYGSKALELFHYLKEEDVMPNQVTFLALLTACSHSGLVNEGLSIFYGMKGIYGVEPGIEHYGCLVDLLGRSGRLLQAKDVIEKMPMKPSRSIWGALLSACKAHGNVEIAERAVREVLRMEPEKAGGYILLSNMYASQERWKYSDYIREVMESRGVKKVAGCSSLTVDGVVHEFVAADKCHSRWIDIHSMLICLKCEMSGIESCQPPEPW